MYRPVPAELHNLAGTERVEALEKVLKGALPEKMILERVFVPLPIPPGHRQSDLRLVCARNSAR